MLLTDSTDATAWMDHLGALSLFLHSVCHRMTISGCDRDQQQTGASEIVALRHTQTAFTHTLTHTQQLLCACECVPLILCPFFAAVKSHAGGVCVCVCASLTSVCACSSAFDAEALLWVVLHAVHVCTCKVCGLPSARGVCCPRPPSSLTYAAHPKHSSPATHHCYATRLCSALLCRRAQAARGIGSVASHCHSVVMLLLCLTLRKGVMILTICCQWWKHMLTGTHAHTFGALLVTMTPRPGRQPQVAHSAVS